ncbi:MAG: acylphosphatase [Xanthobacteraceae bacterium]
MDGIRQFVARRITICGRVQGVGFRAWTEVMALERGVEGWVRNCRDGSVEALFAGPQEVVLTMIALCREGPPGARVDAIDQREAGSADLALRRRGELFSVLGSG